MNKGQWVFIISHAFLYNFFQIIYLWQSNDQMDILNHSYGVHSEIDRQYYVFNLQNLYILGILISGFIWPRFVKKLGNYKSVFLSYFLISLLYFVLSFVRTIHAFMAVTFFIGISQNTFSVGNAFIYDFI